MITVIKKIDGTIEIGTPTLGTTKERLEQDALLTPDYLSHRVIDDNELPQDDYFREAWEDNNAAIVVNMPKAREIHMNRLRVDRNAKLEELDVTYMRADEAGDTELKDSIAAQKQQLRDMPETFDLSVYETPEELKAAIPEYLLS